MVRLLAASLALVVFGCGEARETTYASFDHVKSAGTGALSWFPSWTPPSATKLREWHDIDSNDTFGKFEFSPQFQLPKTCRATIFAENPGSRMEWWPSDAAFRALDHAVCEERVQFGDGHWENNQIGVALDRRSRTLFFWRNGYPSSVRGSPSNSAAAPGEARATVLVTC